MWQRPEKKRFPRKQKSIRNHSVPITWADTSYLYGRTAKIRVGTTTNRNNIVIKLKMRWLYCYQIENVVKTEMIDINYVWFCPSSSSSNYLGKWGKQIAVRLKQWFSTGVPRNPWVPWNVLGVLRISDLYIYLLVNCNQGCCQIAQ